VQHTTITLINATYLIEQYLSGVEGANPLAMYTSARSLLEILAVACGVKRTLQSNAGLQAERFYERVLAVDQVLINGTYGSRDKEFLEAIKQSSGASKLKAITKDDQDNMTSKNVVNWMHKMDEAEYPGAWEMYCRLCEYVHPNLGLNWVCLVPDERSGTVEISRRRPEVIYRAFGNTIEGFTDISRRILDACAMPFPFGDTPADPLSSVSVADMVIALNALPQDVMALLASAPRVTADEVVEYHFALNPREDWEIAGLHALPNLTAPLWLETNR
jgi:hypothetical protein